MYTEYVLFALVSRLQVLPTEWHTAHNGSITQTHRASVRGAFRVYSNALILI